MKCTLGLFYSEPVALAGHFHRAHEVVVHSLDMEM